MTTIKLNVVGYDDGNVKENIPIGTELTAIDLPDDKSIFFWEN